MGADKHPGTVIEIGDDGRDKLAARGGRGIFRLPWTNTTDGSGPAPFSVETDREGLGGSRRQRPPGRAGSFASPDQSSREDERMESVEEGLEAEGARPDRGSANPLSSRIRRRQTKDVTLRLESDEMDSMERGRGAWVRRRWRNVAGPHGPWEAVPHGERASRPGGATPP